MKNAGNIRELLQWYIASGVDETIASTPCSYAAKPPVPEPVKTLEPMKKPAQTLPASPLVAVGNAPITSPAKAVEDAQRLAHAANTLEELREAVMQFQGCALKKTAKNTVFADGNPDARVILIGEAPGEQEDERGIPFCGKSGQLLDNVLASIGLTRAENLYISNTVFWRPPGNRTPTPEEVAMCAPFVQKHIALKNPDLLLLAGGVAGSVLGSQESVSRMRQKFHRYTNHYLVKEIPAVVIYHPSYLLRQPGQKAAAWLDMLMVQEFLKNS